MEAILGRVFVYGGKGALGSACISKFKSKSWVSNNNSNNSNNELLQYVKKNLNVIFIINRTDFFFYKNFSFLIVSENNVYINY